MVSLYFTLQEFSALSGEVSILLGFVFRSTRDSH